MVTESEIRREVRAAAKKLDDAAKAAQSADDRVTVLASILLQKGILDSSDIRRFKAGRL